MTTENKIASGLNYIFYGPNEKRTRESMLEYIKNTPDAVFYPWVLPFTDPFDIKFEKTGKADDNGTFIACLQPNFEWKHETKIKGNIDELFGEKTVVNTKNPPSTSSNKKRYIIFDSVHLLAHSAEDPVKFYRKLLSFCNHHTQCSNIHFLISIAKIPAIFHKENPLRHLWEFVPTAADGNTGSPKFDKFINSLCNDPSGYVLCAVKEWVKIEGKARFDEFSELSDPSIALAFKEVFGASGDINESKVYDPGIFSKFIENITESSLLFNSEIYLQESRKGISNTFDTKSIQEKFKNIIGQDEAIQSLSSQLLISQNRLVPDDSDTKPLGVFLFVGPSGVGKTHLSKKLSEALPGYKFLQINLGEYPDRESVNKLIGLGRGYLDSEYGGILTEPVRLHPRYVILFDELDHAHNSVGQLFYKIFEGEVMDGRGRKISFKDCYVIMTTNRGQLQNASQIAGHERREKIEEILKQPSATDKLEFSDAFLGRIHEIIHFNSLSKADLVDVAANYFADKITRPYRDNIQVKLNFRINGLEDDDQPGLIADNIISTESLFFEIWALKAGANNSQGARRLFQIMDEHLIRPLELARINSIEFAKRNSTSPLEEITFIFDPVLGLTNFNKLDEVEVVLIDDQQDACDAIIKFLPNSTPVVQFGFDQIDRVRGAKVIILDWFDGEHSAGLENITKIRSINRSAPIIIYSSLGESALKQQLNEMNAQYDIFAFVSKNSDGTLLKQSVFSAIKRKYFEANPQIMVSDLRVKPPTSNSPELIFTIDYSKGGTDDQW